MYSSGLINMMLPVGSQVELATSETGSPASCFVQWAHSAVDWKNSEGQRLHEKLKSIRFPPYINICTVNLSLGSAV